jgi:hypothetical protein
MPICRIIESRATPDQYDQVRERLGIADAPPPGASLHVAARGEDGTIRIVEVWDSREQAEEWTKKVMAAREELGVGESGPPEMTYLEVHKLFR